MRYRPMLSLMLTAGLATTLQAQDPHFGFGLNLVFPTGGFRDTTYPPTPEVTSPQHEGYDLGLGGQFTISFPVEPNVALRMNVNGQTTDGTNTAAGYDTIHLKHRMVSLGGEVQVFPGSGAFRHQGTYLLGGLSADFERFDRSFGDPNLDYTETSRKSRMGGTVGVGHSFGYSGAGHFTVEGVYHKTLTGNDESAGDPPSTDFVKVAFGYVF